MSDRPYYQRNYEAAMGLIIFIFVVILIIGLTAFALIIAPSLFAKNIVEPIPQETCPQDGGWTKIDSGDLSLYEVDGATMYCFKAGNWISDTYPDGGFGQDGSCNNGIQYCDLSHWSYYIPWVSPTNTPTPTDIPTSTPTPRVTTTPTATPSATLTPTATSTPTPTDKPKENNDSSTTVSNDTWEEIREVEGEVFGPLK